MPGVVPPAREAAQLLLIPTRPVDTSKRDFEAQPEVSVAGAIDVESLPLQQHGQICGLLKLHEEHPFSDRVRDTRGYQDRIAHPCRESIHCGEEPPGVLSSYPVGEYGKVHIVPEAQIHKRLWRANFHDHPGLSLPIPAVEVTAREFPAGMTVDRESLPRVQQLHQQAGLGPKTLGVWGPQVAFRVCEYRVAEEAAVGQSGYADLRTEYTRRRPDPIFRSKVILVRHTTKICDCLAASIEAVDLIGPQHDRIHLTGLPRLVCVRPTPETRRRPHTAIRRTSALPQVESVPHLGVLQIVLVDHGERGRDLGLEVLAAN